MKKPTLEELRKPLGIMRDNIFDLLYKGRVILSKEEGLYIQIDNMQVDFELDHINDDYAIYTVKATLHKKGYKPWNFPNIIGQPLDCIKGILEQFYSVLIDEDWQNQNLQLL